MLRKLLSHAALYGLAAQVPRVAGVLALPIITPYLTTTDYGVAGVVTAYVGALGLFQSLGLSVVMGNTFTRHPTRFKWVWRQLHGFILLWSALYSVPLVGLLYAVIPDEAEANRWELILLNLVPVVLLSNTSFFGNFLYHMRQRPLPVAAYSFITGGVTVALNIYFIAFLRLGYMGWFYATFVASVAGFVLLFYPVYVQEGLWPIFKFKLYRIRSSLKVSLPLLPHHFSFFLLDASDKLMLDALRVPLPRIGFYNIASSFGLYFSAASNAVVEAATPFYMRYFSKEGDPESLLEARRMTFSLQVLFLGATALGSLWMKEVFELLIRNETLQGAYPLAIIMLMGYTYRPMYLAVVNRLSFQEKTKELWKISLVAGVGNVLLNLLLIPVFGIEAAAFTTFAALVYLGYSGFLLKEYRALSNVPYYPWRWLALTIVLLLAVYALADAGPLLKALISLLILAFAGSGLWRLNKAKAGAL